MPSQTISVTETAGMIRRRQATVTPAVTASSLMSAMSAASTGDLNTTVLNAAYSVCSCLLRTATTGVETVFVTSTSVCTSNQICHVDILNGSDPHTDGLRLCRRDGSRYSNIGSDICYGHCLTVTY